MKYLATVVAAGAVACLITTAAQAVDVCAYTVLSAFGSGCPLHSGVSVCVSVGPTTGACDAALDCIARLQTFFCLARLVPKSGPQARCPAASRRLVGFSCFAPQRSTPTQTATPSPTPTATPGIPPLASLEQQLFRAADGTAYQVVWVDAESTAQVRITTLAGSAAGFVGGCELTPAAIAGQPVSAVIGTLAPAVVLHPFDSIARTGVFMPNDAATVFTPDFGGRLVIGTGAGAVTVCKDAFDCMGQQNVLPLVPLGSSIGGVPAACIADGLMADCDGSNVRDAFAFGLPSQGTPPVCTAPSAVTVNTTLCAAEPADGFTLHSGEFIVFVHDGGLQATGYDAGVAGFGVSAQPAGVCTSGGVISGVAMSPSH